MTARLWTLAFGLGSVLLLLAGCGEAPIELSTPTPVAAAVPRPAATSPPPPRPTAAPPALSPASTPAASRSSTAAPRLSLRLRAGQLGSLAESGLAVGLARRFYAEQDLELQIVPFTSPESVLSALTSGRLDAACLPVSVELFNALARGSSLKIVAEAESAPPGHGAAGLIVRPDLFAGLRTPTDLRGLRVALSARGTSQDVELATLLRKGWLARTDIEQIILPPEAIVPALAEGRLDAAMLAEPLVTEVEAEGIGRVWRRSDRILPNHTTAVLVLNSRFTRTHPEASRRFVTSYLRSARAYNDEFLRARNGDRGELMAVLGGPLAQAPSRGEWQTRPITPAETFERLVLPGLNPNGMVNIQTLRLDQQHFLATGQQHKELDFAAIVDPQFVVHAIQQLGEYR